MAFSPLGNSDHVVSFSIDFPVNSKQDVSFRCVAYDYSRADWDGLHDHLRNVPWEDKSLFISIRSNPTFQQLVLLPYFTTFFVCMPGYI